MVYSTTGLAYLILSFVIGFFNHRVFQYWKKEKNTVSELWLLITSLFLLFTFINAIGGLFFVTNLTFLRFSLNFGAFLQVVAFSLMSYLSVYLKLSPKISPWWGFIPVFILGMISTYLTILKPHNPFLATSGAINWNASIIPSAGDIIRIFLFFIAFVPAIFILFEQFQKSPSVSLKRKILGFIFLFAIAIIGVLFDFIFINNFKLDPIWRDISFIVASFIIFIVFLPDQKEKAFKNNQLNL